MKSDQIIIQNIFKLITEGNARIKDNEDKGILILGKTGAGKSTLTYLLAGEDLKAVENDTGDLCLEAINPSNNIKINHTTISETKIPNKYKVGDITIWDCPGFMDTEGIVQEVTNTFYIQRLFATNKQLKFVLAIPEAVLKSKADLLPIVDQFTNSFNSVEALKNSVSLVITKAAPHKKIPHIQTAINNLIEQNLQHIKPKTLEMLKFLLKSVQIFHSPTNEEVIKNSDILKAINDTTEYVDLSKNSNLANIVISQESTEYAKELLETTYKNINDLANILVTAVNEPAKCVTNSQENIFIQSYSIIKSWLTSSIEYVDFNRLPNHTTNKYFLNLEQLKAFEILRFSNSKLPKDKFLKLLEVFEEFSIDDKSLKQKIQEYAYVFKQQIEYAKFLSQICENKPMDYSYIEQAIQKCQTTTSTALEQAIKAIKIEDGQQDINYYNKALEYLDQYKTDQDCIKNKAIVYANIGCIYDSQSKYKLAVQSYIKALELNKELPKVHERLGDILFNNKQYTEAIKCFKVVDNSVKIENCFKELIKVDPNNLNIFVDKGDYYLSIGRYDKAIGCYNNAFSLSKSDDFKAMVKNKTINSLEKQVQSLQELANQMKNEGLYHYERVNMQDLNQAVYKIPSNDNYKVEISGEIDSCNL